ncbi:MAG: glycine cleavage system protein H [Acidobacteria bacterium]|nr:glycine cleavage system protein H [Acidobacteriota bacterium]
MTVLLILATFLVFILLDYAMTRRTAREAARPEPVRVPVPPALEPVYVEGFLVPQGLRYHPGHSWLLHERKNLVRVGGDEFAAVLAGPIEKIELPMPGRWVRQGQKAWTLHRNGEKTEMVSPIEGEVVAVNPDVVKDPSLLRRDPYGRGWLMTVYVPDEENTTRNLLPTELVRGWLRNAVERLYARQPQLAGAVAADGGRPADDVFAALPDVSWKELTREFFLS